MISGSITAESAGTWQLGDLTVNHQLAEAQRITPVVCAQNRYALDSRTDDANDVLDACREQPARARHPRHR